MFAALLCKGIKLLQCKQAQILLKMILNKRNKMIINEPENIIVNQQEKRMNFVNKKFLNFAGRKSILILLYQKGNANYLNKIKKNKPKTDKKYISFKTIILRL